MQPREKSQYVKEDGTFLEVETKSQYLGFSSCRLPLANIKLRIMGGLVGALRQKCLMKERNLCKSADSVMTARSVGGTETNLPKFRTSAATLLGERFNIADKETFLSQHR